MSGTVWQIVGILAIIALLVWLVPRLGLISYLA